MQAEIPLAFFYVASKSALRSFVTFCCITALRASAIIRVEKYRSGRHHGRGKFRLNQLQMLSDGFTWNALIGSFIRPPLIYYKRNDLSRGERTIFCFLRWLQYTSLYLGYISCY